MLIRFTQIVRRIPLPKPTILKRFKADEVTIKYKKDKVPSRTKKLKLKNHKGAMARWMVMGHGMFKRSKCGRSHLNRKVRAIAKKDKRKRVLASKTQRRLLKKLMPYFKKKYMK